MRNMLWEQTLRAQWSTYEYLNKEGKETNIVPADDFVCEEDFLHVWVPDVIRALILDHLEKIERKINIL